MNLLVQSRGKRNFYKVCRGETFGSEVKFFRYESPKFRKEKGEEIKSMNSFLRKFKPVFRNNRVSIVMILLMLTIMILGVSKSGLFSRNVQAQTAIKTSADVEKPMFELG